MDQFTITELNLLADYFAQELEPEEMIRVERWIEARPDRRRLVEDLRRSRIDLRTDRSLPEWDIPSRVNIVASALSDVWSAEGSPEKPMPIRNSKSSPYLGKNHSVAEFGIGQFLTPALYGFGVFAASLLILLAGWYIGAGNSSHTPVAMYTYTTGNGERATVALPDGSQILMNVGSSIQVPTNYSRDNRTIKLTGEAVFNVIPMPGEPFSVVAGSGTARVLGTSFAVRHYETDSVTTVTVREGRVSVGSVVLAASEAVRVSSTGITTHIPANMRQFAFEKGVLELKDVPFNSAVEDLNRWYDVDIRAGYTGLKHQRISGIFESGSITDLVSNLEFAFNVRVVRDGRTLTIY